MIRLTLADSNEAIRVNKDYIVFYVKSQDRKGSMIKTADSTYDLVVSQTPDQIDELLGMMKE